MCVVLEADNRFDLGIIGDRGIGKTTFLLQYIKALELPLEQKLYVSAEFLLLGSVKLFELAKEFEKAGGKVLVIDEIHQIPDFERDLKMIYDMFGLQVIFSGSNAIKLKQLVVLICSSKLYELNISKLATKIGINRNTIYQYIYYLERRRQYV